LDDNVTRLLAGLLIERHSSSMLHTNSTSNVLRFQHPPFIRCAVIACQWASTSGLFSFTAYGGEFEFIFPLQINHLFAIEDMYGKIPATKKQPQNPNNPCLCQLFGPLLLGLSVSCSPEYPFSQTPAYNPSRVMCPQALLPCKYSGFAPHNSNFVVHPTVYHCAIIAPNNRRSVWACFKTGLLGTRQLVKVAGKQ
jgi:hypothetical protein